MQYYIDGEKASHSTALVLFDRLLSAKGFADAEKAQIWRGKCHEEGRDIIADLTDSRIEFIE